MTYAFFVDGFDQLIAKKNSGIFVKYLLNIKSDVQAYNLLSRTKLESRPIGIYLDCAL